MSELERKRALVDRLLEAKAASGKTFTQIASETGLTNAYIGQLFHRQAQLHDEQATELQEAVPALTSELIDAMKKPPIRCYDPLLLQDPTVYRLNEAVMHYAQTLKAIINEEFGDGIMSAIGFYCSVDSIKGKDGEGRVQINLNGKFLPHVVQKAEENKDFKSQ